MAVPTTPAVALSRPDSEAMDRLVVEKLVDVADVRSVLPVKVVEARVAEEVALRIPMVEVPVRKPPEKVRVVVVALLGNGYAEARPAPVM